MKNKVLLIMAAATLSFFPKVNFGQAPDLGTASSFALFTAVGAFSNIGASTVVTGDVGTNVGAFSAFPPGILVGNIHVADPASAQAATDVLLAYGSLSTVTCGQVISTTMGSGQMLLPDVYCMGAASTINGDLILDGQGDPTSLFIFKIDGALATTVGSRILFTNSASLCNVYWQVNGQVTLGENSLFQGTILANGAIILLEGASLLGRGLSQAGEIALHNNIVTIGLQPIPSIISAGGPTTFCEGGSVTLSGNVGGVWSNGGATTPTITVTTSGDYYVTNSNNCGSVTSDTISVDVYPLPVCTITGDNIICEGQSTELCATPGALSYLWSTTETTSCITVSAAGTYSVTVTDANGCISTCDVTVTVYPLPVCTITGDNIICEGQSTELCTTPGALSYLWSTTETTSCITVSAAGTYSVTVTDANGCISTCDVTVTVYPLPVCTITGDNIICEGQSTELCTTPGALSYLWSTTETTSCITVSAAGTYSVTITDANGCISTCDVTVTVYPLPVCTITGDNIICEGQSTELCTTPGALSYLWSTTETTSCITVSAAGTYSVTVTDANGCISTCDVTVTVYPLPVCTITGDNIICEGQSTELCTTPGALSYLWSTTETTSCITVSAAGTYSVTVTDANGCISTCDVTVTVYPLPVCTITGDNIICEGQSTELCTTPGALSYLWSTTETTSCITVSAAGTYSVTVTDANGCISTCDVTVTVYPLPVCTITGDNIICEGQSTELCATPGALSYLWSTTETTSCITVSAAGTYSVTVTDANGCISTCDVTVTVYPLPVCTITGDNIICEGQSTELCATPGALSYLWSTTETTSCITVSAAGTYSVTVTDANGCISTCSVTVTVYPLPVCTITGGNTPICEGQSTELCTTPGAFSYLWAPTGETTRCITVSTAGTYSVTVTDANGCISTCSVTVTVIPCECQWCNKSAVLSQVLQNMGDMCDQPDILVDVRLPLTYINLANIGTDQPAFGSIQTAVNWLTSHPALAHVPGQLFVGVIATDCIFTIPAICQSDYVRPYAGDNPHGTENVIITNPTTSRLNIFGCSVTMYPLDASKPVITVQNSIGKVTILDLHVKYSHVQGYLVKNNTGLVVVKNSSAWYNDIGIDVQDNNVEVTGAQHINGNRIGIWVEGNNNILRTNSDIINNSYYGIVISGSGNESNGNEVGTKGHPNANGILVSGNNNNGKGIHDGNVDYNTGFGINITGNGNLINQVDIEYNGGKGIAVSGNNNTVNKCTKIDNNGSHGIYVTGASNILSGNESDKNLGDGFNANIGNGATGNKFSKNVAKSNKGYGIRACKQIDLGGNSASGNVLNPQMSFTCALRDDLAISDDLAGTDNTFDLYPNPTQGNVTIMFNSTNAGKYFISVIDMTGRVISREVVEAQQGKNVLEVDLSKVDKGIYILVIENTVMKNSKRIIVQ